MAGSGSGVSGVSGTAVAATAAGALLIVSGVKGWGVSQSLRSVLSGQKPAGTNVNPISGDVTAAAAATSALSTSADVPPADLTGTEAANRALGKVLAASYGWATGTNWQALDYGWGTLESGWNNSALNGSWPSGAYGIPQAHPGNKMPQAAWPVDAGGANSATAQILWGLSYIKSTYGSPSQVPGWLGQGGYEGY
jgi:hypothetical protein